MLNELRLLIEKSVTRHYSAGSTVIYQGEVPRSACIIKKGVIRAFSISSQGDEQIVTYYMPGEFFPLPWIYSKTPGSMYFYEASEDSEIAFVPKDELVQFMSLKPSRMPAMLDYFITNYTALL